MKAKLVRFGTCCSVGTTFEITPEQARALERWSNAPGADLGEDFGCPYSLAVDSNMDEEYTGKDFDPELFRRRLDEARDGLLAATDCIESVLDRYGEFDAHGEVRNARTDDRRAHAFDRACEAWLDDPQTSDEAQATLREAFECAKSGDFTRAVKLMEHAAAHENWKQLA